MFGKKFGTLAAVAVAVATWGATGVAAESNDGTCSDQGYSQAVQEGGACFSVINEFDKATTDAACDTCKTYIDANKEVVKGCHHGALHWMYKMKCTLYKDPEDKSKGRCPAWEEVQATEGDVIQKAWSYLLASEDGTPEGEGEGEGEPTAEEKEKKAAEGKRALEEKLSKPKGLAAACQSKCFTQTLRVFGNYMAAAGEQGNAEMNKFIVMFEEMQAFVCFKNKGKLCYDKAKSAFKIFTSGGLDKIKKETLDAGICNKEDLCARRALWRAYKSAKKMAAVFTGEDKKNFLRMAQMWRSFAKFSCLLKDPDNYCLTEFVKTPAAPWQGACENKITTTDPTKVADAACQTHLKSYNGLGCCFRSILQMVGMFDKEAKNWGGGTGPSAGTNMSKALVANGADELSDACSMNKYLLRMQVTIGASKANVELVKGAFTEDIQGQLGDTATTEKLESATRRLSSAGRRLAETVASVTVAYATQAEADAAKTQIAGTPVELVETQKEGAKLGIEIPDSATASGATVEANPNPTGVVSAEPNPKGAAYSDPTDAANGGGGGVNGGGATSPSPSDTNLESGAALLQGLSAQSLILLGAIAAALLA